MINTPGIKITESQGLPNSGLSNASLWIFGCTAQFFISLFKPFSGSQAVGSIASSKPSSFWRLTVIKGVLITSGLIGFTSSPATAQDTRSPLVVVSDERMLSQEVCDAFEKKTGIPVQWITPNNNDEAFAYLIEGRKPFDVVIQEADFSRILLQNGLLAKLDKADIPNLKNIDPLWLGGAPDPENTFMLPLNASLLGFLRNTSVSQPPLTSFNDGLGKKRPGGVLCFVSARTLVGAAFVEIGATMDSNFQETLRSVRPIFKSWIPNIAPISKEVWKNRVAAFPEARASFLSGQQAAALLFSGDAVSLLREGPGKFEWITPSNGILPWINKVAISSSTSKSAEAHEFANFLFEPSTAAMLVAHYPAINSLKPSFTGQTMPDGSSLESIHSLIKGTALFMGATPANMREIREFFDSLPPPGEGLSKP